VEKKAKYLKKENMNEVKTSLRIKLDKMSQKDKVLEIERVQKSQAQELLVYKSEITKSPITPNGIREFVSIFHQLFYTSVLLHLTQKGRYDSIDEIFLKYKVEQDEILQDMVESLAKIFVHIEQNRDSRVMYFDKASHAAHEILVELFKPDLI
jgi:hypothetical protein